MIGWLSLVNLEEWSNEELEKGAEIFLSLFHKVKEGEEISFLDFAPEFKKILRDKTYGLWRPPGNIQVMLRRPVANLASMLDKGKPVPSVLLVPLDSRRSKAEFIEYYGLVPEKGGSSYDVFIQEIRKDRILPILIELPAHYRADFYQEILRACEQGEIQQPPPFLPARVSHFMEKFSLSVSAMQEGIPPEEGWKDLVLQKHPEYDFESWLEKVMSILPDREIQNIQKQYRLPHGNKEYVASVIATSATNLSMFGFSSLVNLSLELLKKIPLWVLMP
jgi:hypothetical protein